METLPNPRPTPHWPLLILFALALLAGVYALYYAFHAQAALNAQLATQNQKLGAQLGTLQRLLSARASTDQVVVPMQAELAQNRQVIAALEARLQSVEKTAATPAPVVQVTHQAGETETLQAFLALKQAVSSGVPFSAQLATMDGLPQLQPLLASLAPRAEKGVASDTALRGQLHEILAAHPYTPTVEDPKLSRINTTFKGLLHISRNTETPTDVYAPLRAQADTASLDVLVTSTTQLTAEAQAPLAAWLAAARERQAALATLAAAETALMKPVP